MTPLGTARLPQSAGTARLPQSAMVAGGDGHGVAGWSRLNRE
jgi:hypothetical protein